jgi:hypothetical protein
MVKWCACVDELLPAEGRSTFDCMHRNHHNQKHRRYQLEIEDHSHPFTSFVLFGGTTGGLWIKLSGQGPAWFSLLPSKSELTGYVEWK